MCQMCAVDLFCAWKLTEQGINRRDMERWNQLSCTHYNEIPLHAEYAPTEKRKGSCPSATQSFIGD